MTYRETSYQKHTRKQSLTIQPLNQPNMQEYVHSVSIFNIKNGNTESTLLNQEEALQLRDSMLKSYPLSSYPLIKGK